MSYLRPSHRNASTLRPLSAELSPLYQADGSASLKSGNTHVLVAVHGPIAPRLSSRERYDGAMVSVVFSRGLSIMASSASSATSVNKDDSTVASSKNVTVEQKEENGAQMKTTPVPLPTGGGASERELEYFIRDILSSCIMLEEYPRCVIQVVIQIVQADGSVVSTAANCAVMALMDAGIAMRGLPVTTTCVAINANASAEILKEDAIWLDPTSEEESGEGHSSIVIATDSSSLPNSDLHSNQGWSQPQIIATFTYGAPIISMEILRMSVKSIQQSNAAMIAFMRLVVERKVQREVQTLWS